MDALQQLQERRVQRARDFRAIVDRTGGAHGEDRAYTDEEDADLDRIRAEIEGIDARIARAEQAAGDERTIAAIETPQRTRGLMPGAGPGSESPDEDRDGYDAAFGRYLRGGMAQVLDEDRRQLIARRTELPAEEARAIGGASGATGGFLVAGQMANTIITARETFGGMRVVSNVISTDTGSDLEFPVDNESGVEGEILAENAAAAEGDPTFDQRIIRALIFSSKIVRAPFSLLQDSAFDLEGYLARALVRRIERRLNRALTTGSGAGEPQGVGTKAAVGRAGAAGQTTTVVFDDLQDLIDSIDPAYLADARFMFRSATRGVIAKLKDGDGRPIWQPSLQVGNPDVLMGYPITINQDVPAMAASAKSILFGWFGGYTLRDVSGISLLRFDEKYGDRLQVGFLAWSRHDGALLDLSAVKQYQNSAA